MSNSKSHPLHYTEAHYRGKVDETRWGTTWGAVAGAGATVGAAHAIGKYKLPENIVTRGIPELVDGKVIHPITSKTPVPGGGKTVNEAIKSSTDQLKNAKSANLGDDAVKALKVERRMLRRGKWGAAAAAGLVVGSVAAGVGGAIGKTYGTFQGPRPEQQEGWAAKEDARRNVTVNLENAR